MTSEEVTNSRRVRSLLATDTGAEVATFYNDSNIMVYYTSTKYKEKYVHISIDFIAFI